MVYKDDGEGILRV